LSRTANLDVEGDQIVFDPIFRPQPEPGYWLELALAFSDPELAQKAARLGPLSGSQSGTESVAAWQLLRSLLLGVLRALLTSRPDILAAVDNDELRDLLAQTRQEQVPRWHSLADAATALIRDERAYQVTLVSLAPATFDAATRIGQVLAHALNESMKANGIAACTQCGTVFTTAARPRQYCTPACRKAACIEGRDK
jgi:hypothetical protein